MTSPYVVTTAPKTGWPHTIAHIVAGVLGAALAGAAAFDQVTGTVPRTTAIVVGALVFLGALLSWASATYKIVAQDEARVKAEINAHVPDFKLVLAEFQTMKALLPTNWTNRLVAVESTATEALNKANAISQAITPAPAVVVPAPVVSQPAPPTA